MRIEVQKYLFAGLERNKLAFFEEAQIFGKIQFKDKEEKAPPAIEKAMKALKILQSNYVGPNDLIPPKDIVENVLKTSEELAATKERLKQTRIEICRIKPFGEFDFELVRLIEKETRLKARFYQTKCFIEDKTLFHIAEVNDCHYYFSFQSHANVVEMNMNRSLASLQADEISLLERQGQLVKKLQEYAAFLPAIEKEILFLFDRHHLTDSIKTADNPVEKLFSCTGWLPQTHIEKAKEMAKKLGVHMERIEPDSNETIPTYFENDSWGKVGEDLVDIFDTPSHSDKDPSYWVLLAFALFFAFIIGDGGYGAVFLGLLLFLKYKNPNLKGIQKRMLNLGMLLSCFCIGWGLLTHAFFNLSIDLDSPIRKLSLVTHLAEMKADYILKTKAFQYADWIKSIPNAETGHDILRNSSGMLSALSDHVLLELSLFIGVLHMMTGMFRYLFRNIQLIGWILFLAGSYLYLPYFLQVPSLIHYALHIPFEAGAIAGLYMIGIGCALAVGIAIYKHGITGIFELMNAIGIFSDALSYLRLYALALAGSIVSATINSASAELPLVFAIVLIVLAHVINMGLGIMGGVIHGLRLNFLEWYHYSFEGGGKKFKPLALME